MATGSWDAAAVVAQLEAAADRLRVERTNIQARETHDRLLDALDGLDRARVEVRDARVRLAALEAELRL